MIIEEALKHMREGKKITHHLLGENVYLMVYYAHIQYFDETGKKREPTPQELERIKKQAISIVKMTGNRMHLDMTPKNFPLKQTCCDPELHSYPQLNLFILISDEWEIME